MTTTKGILFVVGERAEFAGIALIGFPDILPGALRASVWLRQRYERTRDRFLRLIGRPLTIRVSVEPAVSISTAGRVQALVSVADDATLERKVEFLLRRKQEAQRALDDLRWKLKSLEEESPRRLDELRGSMERHVAVELAAALAAYRPLRATGAVALAIGLFLTTTTSFVG